MIKVRLKFFLLNFLKIVSCLVLISLLGTAPSVHAYERELLSKESFTNNLNLPYVLSPSPSGDNLYSYVVSYNGGEDIKLNPDPDNSAIVPAGEAAIVKYTDEWQYLKHVTIPDDSTLTGDLVVSDTTVYVFLRVMYDSSFCGQYGWRCLDQIDVDPGENEVLVTLPDDHEMMIILTLDQDLNYLQHHALWDIPSGINGSGSWVGNLKTDAEGNLYYGGSQKGVIDYDLGLGVSEINCPSVQCAVFAKYNADLELEYVYSWQSEQPAFVNDIHLQGDYIYLGIPLNATGEYTMDFDPTDGTDEKDFFEHSSTIVKFNKNGEYIWSHTLTSLDLVGQYPLIDDDWYSASTIDNEGNVYVCSYIESDAVNFAGQTFEATSTAGNKGDLFIYRLDSDGSENWGKMFNPQQSNGWADCNSSGGFYNPFEDTITFTGRFLDTALDGSLNSGAKADAHTFTISPDGSEYSFNQLYEIQDSSEYAISLHFFPYSTDNQFRLFATLNSSSGVDNNTIEGNLYGVTFNDFVLNSGDIAYYLMGWRWYDPDQNTSSSHKRTSQLTKKIKSSPKASNPNLKDGWKHPISAGPSFVGTHGFIPNSNVTSDETRLASVYLDQSTHHDDLYIEHSTLNFFDIVVDLITNPDGVVFPWIQGFNTVSEINKIEAKASFNGYPVTETDNPFIILLGYDQNKLVNIPKEQLKIARFNEDTKKWETIKGEYVYPDGKIATVTNKFGYFAVVYPRSWWGSR